MPSGAGFTDTNGVWVIGEADIASPITDQLRKVGDSIGPQLTALKNKLVSLKTAAQTLSTAAQGTLTFDASPIHATPGLTFAPGTGIGTCVIAGLYRIDVQIEYAANATGSRYAIIQVAPVATGVYAATRNTAFAASSTGLTTTIKLTDYVQLAVGDKFRINGEQTSGGNLNVTNAILEAKLA